MIKKFIVWRWQEVKPKMIPIPENTPEEWVPPVAYAVESGPWYYGLPKIKGRE
jgi:hypothetical protein